MKNSIFICLLAKILAAAAPAARAQSPQLDPSFTLTSAVGRMGTGTAGIGDMLLQPDGKLVVAGDFVSLNGRPAFGVARLLPDGQVDTTFAAPPTSNVTAPAFNLIRSIALQADGKLLIGGSFTAVGGQPRVGLARLLPDGTLDAGFVPPYTGGPPPFAYTTVEKIAVQPGRGILLLGDLITGTRPTRYAARLLEATGAEDPTFQLPSNTANNIINDLLVLPTGRLVFAGRPNLFNGQPCTVWGGLPDGALDPAFVPLPGINSFSWAYTLSRDPATSNLYVVRGTAGMGNLDLEPVRLLPNGVPDPTFSVATTFTPGVGGPNSMVVQPNGRVLMGGLFPTAIGSYFGSVRLLPSGALDASYDPSRGPGSEVNKVLIQPDGKLLFAGLFDNVAGLPVSGLTRMLDPNVLGSRARDDAHDLAIWPVPAHDVLHLRLGNAGGGPLRVALLDMLGRTVLHREVAAGQSALTLPTAGLPPGGYLLRVDFAAGPPAYRRVAVE